MQPNLKYGYNRPITLCLRGVTGIGNLMSNVPFNVNLIGAKITTDNEGNPTIESWEDAIFVKDDGSIDWKYMELMEGHRKSKPGFYDFTDTKKSLFTIVFDE